MRILSGKTAYVYLQLRLMQPGRADAGQTWREAWYCELIPAETPMSLEYLTLQVALLARANLGSVQCLTQATENPNLVILMPYREVLTAP